MAPSSLVPKVNVGSRLRDCPPPSPTQTPIGSARKTDWPRSEEEYPRKYVETLAKETRNNSRTA
ncbi:hypothetical protein QCA50_012659 [Cerrena zonata]|uniref:Uncharacterized protein n=1 Tax=Cerrena zonata TaxID=2478898 RepID=A0AAW0FZQ2_9APHY